ncbi:hypothetical protein J415_16750 [Klebsiella michiganensis HKOPL1]|nr:hypothetical protein J415_16750 [Klebsiella michiganensis HKOPL1]
MLPNVPVIKHYLKVMPVTSRTNRMGLNYFPFNHRKLSLDKIQKRDLMNTIKEQ